MGCHCLKGCERVCAWASADEYVLCFYVSVSMSNAPIGEQALSQNMRGGSNACMSCMCVYVSVWPGWADMLHCSVKLCFLCGSLASLSFSLSRSDCVSPSCSLCLYFVHPMFQLTLWFLLSPSLSDHDAIPLSRSLILSPFQSKYKLEFPLLSHCFLTHNRISPLQWN
jgi:hypothetical protein